MTARKKDPVVAQIERWRLEYLRATAYGNDEIRSLRSYVGAESMWPALRRRLHALRQEVQLLCEAADNPLAKAEVLENASNLIGENEDDLSNFLFDLTAVGESILAAQNPALLKAEQEKVRAKYEADKAEGEARDAREARPATAEPDDMDRHMAEHFIECTIRSVHKYVRPRSERERIVAEITLGLLPPEEVPHAG